MKTVANLGSIQVAQNLKMKLGSVGIEAFIPDEMSASVAPHLFMDRSGIRLQVAETDEDLAKKIINDEFDHIESLPPDDGED